MLFFTILAGLVTGILTGHRLSGYLLTLFYWRNLTSKKKFLDLYDLVDDEFHFMMYSGTTNKPPKKYADYLRTHQKKRDGAYEVYKNYSKELRKVVLKYIGLAAVIPTTLLFFTTWYSYLVTYALVILGFVIYKRCVKNSNLDFHAILLVSLIFNNKEK